MEGSGRAIIYGRPPIKTFALTGSERPPHMEGRFQYTE